MECRQFIRHVEATQNAFRRFLLALCCGDAQLADDIAQESYIKAYLSCHGLNDVRRFKSWLYRIGYTTFLNFRRSEHISVDYDCAHNLPAPDSSDRAFEYQALYAALNRLPPKERTSVLLYYLEGYAVAEIAVIEDSTTDAVKQHLSRGRAHLRGLLTK